MKNAPPRIVLCNGADPPQQWAQDDNLVLEYREFSNKIPNVKLGLPSFIHYVSHFPDRILDLLEIAAYVFCADRLTSRGNKATWSPIVGQGHFTLSLRFEILLSGIGLMSRKNSKKRSSLCPAIRHIISLFSPGTQPIRQTCLIRKHFKSNPSKIQK